MMVTFGRPPRSTSSPWSPSCAAILCAWKSGPWALSKATGPNSPRGRVNDAEGKEMPMDMEKLVALCRRRGFIFQSSEVYGGINGFWDYGPLGVELKRNIKDAWWR